MLFEDFIGKLGKSQISLQSRSYLLSPDQFFDVIQIKKDVVKNKRYRFSHVN